MENEIWLPVKGFEDRFKISNHGRLISINGTYNGNRFLKLNGTNRGYCQLILHDKPRKRRVYIHTLVAEHFISDKPNGNRMTVNHKDGDKSNNHFSNLEWIELADNVRHAHKTGLINSNGTNSYCSKLTPKDIFKILELHNKKYSQRKIAAMFPVCRTTIRGIINGVYWKSVTGLNS